MSAWGNSFGAAFGLSFGAPLIRATGSGHGSYNPGAEGDDLDFINQQNRMLTTMVLALVASGALA